MGCKVSKSAAAAAAEAAGPVKKAAGHDDDVDSLAHLDLDGDVLDESKTASASSLSKPNNGTTKKKHLSETVSSSFDSSTAAAGSPASKGGSDRLYRYLVKAQRNPLDQSLQERCLSAVSPEQAQYCQPTTKSTPLHMAVRLLDAVAAAAPQDEEVLMNSLVPTMVQNLIRAHPDAVHCKDVADNLPLHYAIAPSLTEQQLQQIGGPASPRRASEIISHWRFRGAVVRLLMAADIETAVSYMCQNDVDYDSVDATGGCTPLYRVLQSFPDDFDPEAPTVQFLALIRDACRGMVGVGNASDGDKPLSLLYRRFTRQFDLAEKFFAGDNSRPAVVEHRRKFKQAAGNSWRCIELLLSPEESHLKNGSQNKTANSAFRIVHRAVQVETPPDLLRYIVETNAEDLTVADGEGNLPLHYAAKSKPPAADTKASFPAFYTKYVVDELLYKFPEAAGIPDRAGIYPLTLAVRAGKQWIGGGIKSLYDAYPEALAQINLREHTSLRRVLSMDAADTGGMYTPKEEKVDDLSGSIIRDEQHDAIMLVQQDGVDVSEVVTSMWAHEEDAGVQMLGCVAISKMISSATSRSSDESETVLRISLSAVAAVVNAMKAHPNEVIVQEKACHALKVMAQADGRREVSFVASGAVAAVVGAMQAHVSDQGVQEEACGALTEIILSGGSDRATVIASVSGLTAIVNAIAAHPDVSGVQRDGCAALRQLTEHPHANLPELPKSQTEPLLQAARNKFPAETAENVDILLSRLS